MMEEREKMTVEREARLRAGEPRRTDERAQAVSRYLVAFAYADAGGDHSTRSETAAPEPAR